VIVTCARCLAEYPEDDPAVMYAGGDWWCWDESACGDRLAALLEAVDGI
jgi:hypothetical protein